VRFLLGSHMPHWLATAEFPLFVSHRRLDGRKTLPRAGVDWALDSGGFTELQLHGQWVTSADSYVAAVRRYSDQIGRLAWAAPRDWMCEPVMLAKTGLSVAEHQRLTTEDYLDLRTRAADLPFVPVLQGWTIEDYLRHADAYDRAGVDLARLPLVGVGSVCRRQATGEIERLFATLARLDLPLHGFGVKMAGLLTGSQYLTSADSMAWSYQGRRVPTRCGSTTHRNEGNCYVFATGWRRRVLASCAVQQLDLGEIA
jgi:hypothetical protein